MFIQGCKLDWSNTDSNTYLRHIPALQTDYIPFTKPVTIFTGENGTGKSTLLEAMDCQWIQPRRWHQELCLFHL